MQIDSNGRIFVAGITGSGKTVLCKQILLPLYKRVVFWDIKLENNDMLKLGYKLCRNPTELKYHLGKGVTHILYQPTATTADDFDMVCKIVFYTGNICLFVDEVNSGDICSPSTIQQFHREIMIRGRSRGIGIINVTQRPRAVHNTIISESGYFFIFLLQLDTDVAKIKHILKGEYLDRVTSLPKYHCIFKNTYGNTISLKPVRLR